MLLLFLTVFSEIIKSISSHKDGHRVTFLKPGLILFQENKKSGRKFYIAPRSSGGIYDYVLRSRENCRNFLEVRKSIYLEIFLFGILIAIIILNKTNLYKILAKYGCFDSFYHSSKNFSA